jgi:hypothetical protein
MAQVTGSICVCFKRWDKNVYDPYEATPWRNHTWDTNDSRSLLNYILSNLSIGIVYYQGGSIKKVGVGTKAQNPWSKTSILPLFHLSFLKICATVSKIGSTGIKTGSTGFCTVPLCHCLTCQSVLSEKVVCRFLEKRFNRILARLNRICSRSSLRLSLPVNRKPPGGIRFNRF